MKKLYFLPYLISCLLFSQFSSAQTDLPVGFSDDELLEMQSPAYRTPKYDLNKSSGIPPGGSLRTMGQWEETQALLITWITYPPVLRDIVRAVRTEVPVYIVCGPGCSNSTYPDSTAIKNYLTAGGVPLSNVGFIYAPCNSVWIRDYGAQSVYRNDVDSLLLVDWKYNRPTRVKDDTIPRAVGRKFNLPVFETTPAPNLVINTGGNWISDGLGNSFHSNLIVMENPQNTIAQTDTLLKQFMGITQSVKLPVLPYDGIHHLDMHMKLLNEETLLVGQYPTGVADGPQIEANLQFILSNVNSPFGTPYKVVRIPQPPDSVHSYTYPNTTGDYLTYTNSTIINKTVIVPQFFRQYDTTALRIWRQAMPGYRVVGIKSYSTISASGSLHCITNSVGANEPLLIVHQNLSNTGNTASPYQVDARIQHKSGIQFADIYYTSDTALGYQMAAMTLTNATLNTWTGYIPAFASGSRIYYYIKAHANNGKEQVRPLPAPVSSFVFDVTSPASVTTLQSSSAFTKSAFPNPSHGITCIPVLLNKSTKGSLVLMDLLGKVVVKLYEGDMPEGEKNYFLNSIHLPAGAYLLVLQTDEGRVSQKLMVR